MAKCERALSFEVGRPYFTYPSYAQTSFSITFMLSLYCKATKLLPGTVDVLFILFLLCCSYAPLLLILQLSMARPFQNKKGMTLLAQRK